MAAVAPAALRALALAALLGVTVAGCGGLERRNPVGTVQQSAAPVPAGPHLYCIANVGHTLVAYDLATRSVRADTARVLELDPVGPWFADGAGYYISRVDTSGAGANALIRFDPVTTAETARLKFPQNSNPNSLLLLPAPHAGLAWVALRGSTFDSFTTDGIAVVTLDALRDTAFCDLNADTATCARLVPDTGAALTSPLGFLWDGACGSAGCAYAIVNNFDGAVRDGMLLVLEPDAQGRPTLREAVRLGRNPQLDIVLHASGALWVVNNGGFVHFDATGRAGTLQVLDTHDWQADPDGDGLPGRTIAIESDAVCQARPLPNPDPGCDPTGIFALDAGTAWVTTYPHDVLRVLELGSGTLASTDASLPRLTGPLFPVTIDPLHADGRALFTALGGLGLARLGELERSGAALLSDQPLQAGAAPLSCGAYPVP